MRFDLFHLPQITVPYRTRRVLLRIGTAALALLMLFVIGWFCWIMWLERYIVYTRDGAVLNLDLPAELPEGMVATPPSNDSSVDIYFNEGDNAVDNSKELTQLNGYYISTDVLSGDIPAARERLDMLPDGTAVMIDVKSAKGNFYYSSELPEAHYANIDIAAADDLISQVIHGDYYAIARVPAFRDYNFGLNHVPSGLAHTSGQYLWMDESGCYWLDPTDSAVLNYIMDIVAELKAMGFDEVVLTDFRFPITTSIRFDGDKDAAISSAMTTVLNNCAADGFTVSFVLPNPGYPLPDGRIRLYLEGVSASSVGATAAQVVITDPEIRLVFIAETNDTRYDQYGVLRPLEAADVLVGENQQ